MTPTGIDSTFLYLHVLVRVTVPSKNITVTEDAYERLKALKREDESFSDLVVRLTENADPMAFAGSCPGLGEHVEAARRDLDDDLADRHDELFG